MSKLASFIVTTVDGFYAGPNNEFDWPLVDAEFNDFAVAQLDQADTLLFGRATYEHMASYWPTDFAKANDPAITVRMNDMAKLVFSRRLEVAEWSNTKLMKGEASEHIPTLKAAPGRDLLVLGSPHLTANLIEAGLLDEVRLMINPIALGRGHSLFEDSKDRVPLQLDNVRQFKSGNILLTYRPGA
jgi:dihydrofolate reductase